MRLNHRNAIIVAAIVAAWLLAMYLLPEAAHASEDTTATITRLRTERDSARKALSKLQVHHATHHRRWPHSEKAWEWAARWTLRAEGCTENEVRMMMWIHDHEGGPNSRNTHNTKRVTDDHLGGWQLKYSIAKTGAWWSPVWSTRRALKYVRGHKYAGYGSGVEAAYLHKRARDWY